MRQQSVNLDLLRATAVLMVLGGHWLEALGLRGSGPLRLWGLTNIGHIGVLMFFIHTSLVLMMSLDRISSQNTAFVLPFYIRRAFRIYPLSMVTVVAVLALHIPAYFEPVFLWPGAKASLANLFLVQNVTGSPSVVGPLWSLPYEVQMYVLLPFIFMAARRLRSQFGAAVLVAGGFALWWMEARVAAVFGYQPLFSYAPWFAMGCAAYVLGKTAKPSVSSAWYVFCLSGFVGLALLANRTIRGYRYGWAIWGLGILFAFALPHFKDVTAAPLRRMAHSIATYSYGLYLWHVPILWLAFQKLHQLPRGAQFAICVVLLIVLPYFLHRFVESPMIILGARIARSSERTRPQTGILGREANQSASA